MTEAFVVILMGPPGAGKGTLASPLSGHLNVPHISTGDLFREHMRKSTSLGLRAKGFIDQGHLVPDELVLDMLFERIAKPDCKNGCILDGFPRTIHQAKILDKTLKGQKICVLNLLLEDAVIVERVTGRLSCKHCGKIYHVKRDPPLKPNICDECQGDLFQREDDREEIIRKRLHVYRLQTAPLIDYYAAQKGVLRQIDAKNKKDQVFQDVLEALPIAVLK